MHTREALEALKNAIKGLGCFEREKLSPSAHTPQESKKLLDVLGAAETAPAQPSEDVAAQLRHKIRAAVKVGQLSDIGARELRDAAWLLWDAQEPMARELPQLLNHLVILAGRRASVRRSLIEAWLRDFTPNLSWITEAGRKIHHMIETSTDARVGIWRNAHVEVKLFDANLGPRQFALKLLIEANPVQDVLARLGFVEPIRATGGYMRQVQTELLQFVPNAIRGQEGAKAFGRISDFLTLDGKLRFGEPQQRGTSAQSLLGAWFDGGREPSDDIAQKVQRFLLDHLGVPRIAPQNWQYAGEKAKAKMQEWLTRESLRAFFGLIGEHANDEHWEFRGAFWGAYLDREAITDAWLALGANAFNSAKAVPELKGSYGKLAGASADHSVLLIRIQDLIFCEWSHSGRLRVWPANEAPHIGERDYQSSKLRRNSLPFPPDPVKNRGGNAGQEGISHFNSKEGYWQSSAAELIRRKTGIDLSFDDWMPPQHRRRK